MAYLDKTRLQEKMHTQHRISAWLFTAIPRGRQDDESERNMTRWFVGVKQNGDREVFTESAGVNPIAAPGGYVEVCGPYTSERDALAAAKGKPSPNRKSRESATANVKSTGKRK
jgi:hypothetical protein